MSREENGKRKITDKLIFVIAAIATVVFILTFSIGLPIYFRPFYYMQIGPLGLEEETGYTRDEIIDGYDEVLDYLTLPGGKFGAGVFKYSEEGASHFEDCKGLFTLNAVLLVISTVIIVCSLVLSRRGVISLRCSFLGSAFGFGGALTLGLISVIAALVSLDFSFAFTVFHKIFFPGKDNWVFDPRTDEIILAMPMEFFLSSAVLIAVSVIALSVSLTVFGILKARKEEKKAAFRE